MSPSVHPTMLLHMDLDEAFYSEKAANDITRAYLYIAPVTVGSHPTDPERPENYLRYIFKLRYPYWDASVEGADDTWENSMLTKLKNMFYKVSSTLVNINREARTNREEAIDFSWLEIEFGEHVIAMHLGEHTSIPKQALDLVNQVRTLFNSGLLRELSPALVRLPSLESFVEQEAEVRAQIAEREAAEKASADAEAVAVEGVEGLDEAEAVVAEVAESDVVESDVEAPVDEADAVEAKDAEESALQPISYKPVYFDVDFSIWGLEFTDGTTQQYNPDTDSLLN